MESTKPSLFHLPRHPTLFPEPLHITKREQRAAFHPRVLRAISHRQDPEAVYSGQLDDLISEISEDLFYSPPTYTYASLSHRPERDATSEEEPFAWSKTPLPLPISRLPSTEPLKVKKTRNSRSSTSEWASQVAKSAPYQVSSATRRGSATMGHNAVKRFFSAPLRLFRSKNKASAPVVSDPISRIDEIVEAARELFETNPGHGDLLMDSLFGVMASRLHSEVLESYEFYHN